jgi:hypothetical protein
MARAKKKIARLHRKTNAVDGIDRIEPLDDLAKLENR